MIDVLNASDDISQAISNIFHIALSNTKSTYTLSMDKANQIPPSSCLIPYKYTITSSSYIPCDPLLS